MRTGRLQLISVVYNHHSCGDRCCQRDFRCRHHEGCLEDHALFLQWMVRFRISTMGYVKMFLFILIGYLLVMVLDFRRIKRIPMDQALKNVE